MTDDKKLVEEARHLVSLMENDDIWGEDVSTFSTLADRLEAQEADRPGATTTSGGAGCPASSAPTPPEADAELVALRKLAERVLDQPWNCITSGPVVGGDEIIVRPHDSCDQPCVASYVLAIKPKRVLCLLDRLTEAEGRAEKWHKAAMDAGVVVCTDGRLIFAAKDRAKRAEASLSTTQAKLEAARGALEPFARIADKFGDAIMVEVSTADHRNPAPSIQPLHISALRNARAALQETAQ